MDFAERNFYFIKFFLKIHFTNLNRRLSYRFAYSFLSIKSMFTNRKLCIEIMVSLFGTRYLNLMLARAYFPSVFFFVFFYKSWRKNQNWSSRVLCTFIRTYIDMYDIWVQWIYKIWYLASLTVHGEDLEYFFL